MTTTKHLLAFSLAIVLLSSCDNSLEKKEVDSSGNIFTKAVGGPVSPTVAARWVARKTRTAGREEAFSVSAENLNALLDRMDDKLGVILHHAQDLTGQHHLIIAPVKSDLQSWTNGEVLDAASNQFVDEQLASSWVSAYKASNPEGPWSHFYGIDLFDEITSTRGFSTLDVKPGESEDGQFPLLLYVWTADLSGGKTKSEASVYDQGAICPPLCPAIE